MTIKVGSTNWISENNKTLQTLETGAFTQLLPFEFGIELEENSYSFTLLIETTGVKIVPGITSSCEVIAKLPNQIAEKINRGDIFVADAISEGVIKISGNVSKLLESNALLSHFASSLQSALESTN